MDIILPIAKRGNFTWLIENNMATKKNLELYYRTAQLPLFAEPGDKCYISINKKIIGYHLIKRFENVKEPFECQITGKVWPKGIYIVRDARTWVKLEKPLKFRFIRSWTYYKGDGNGTRRN